jgi:hypothetical protein
MRLIILLLALLAASGPAAALDWKEYNYPDFSFSVSFPADPKLETATYQAANGRPVEAHVYSVALGDSVFKMTIADMRETGLEENAVVDHAVKTLAQEGELKVDIPHRINWIYGRQLSIQSKDGSRSSVAVFYYKRQLYQIEGTTLPSGSNSATSDAIRFQQSLTFTDS